MDPIAVGDCPGERFQYHYPATLAALRRPAGQRELAVTAAQALICQPDRHQRRCVRVADRDTRALEAEVGR